MIMHFMNAIELDNKYPQSKYCQAELVEAGAINNEVIKQINPPSTSSG
jgi:hypothetical protein